MKTELCDYQNTLEWVQFFFTLTTKEEGRRIDLISIKEMLDLYITHTRWNSDLHFDIKHIRRAFAEAGFCFGTFFKKECVYVNFDNLLKIMAYNNPVINESDIPPECKELFVETIFRQIKNFVEPDSDNDENTQLVDLEGKIQKAFKFAGKHFTIKLTTSPASNAIMVIESDYDYRLVILPM